MANEEDDPIIQEIDVFLARSLLEKLYLFQYPIRPASMTYDDVTHLSAKIKPKQQKVELEMAIDTLNPNYCRSKGEQIALNVDGTCTDETSTYSSKLMDKQTFCSSQAASNVSRYAAAVYRKGELHLTPLHGILQLRPSFTYLDKADAKHREREAANEGGDSSQDEAEDDVKQITVRFSRPETEQARQRRVQSYEFLQKRQAEEHWVHLHYYGLKDSRSEHERQYLFSQGHGLAENTELIKSPSEYLMMLMPPSVEEENSKPVAPSNVLSMAQLRTLPLADQIKILMKNVKVMPFANLMSLLGSGTDSTAVLRCIQQVAMLVQGNWVVKSDVLYPKDTSSPHSGVPAEVLCRGRDFVMWKFTQDRWVVRKEVAAVTKLCPEDVKDFLEHMSVARINKGWEFMLPYDEDFVKKHPDIVQRQRMLWMGIQAKLEKVYNLVKEHLTPKKQESQSGHPLLVSGEQRVNMAKAKVKQNYGQLEKEFQKQKAELKSSDTSSKIDVSNIHIKEEPVSDEEPMDTSVYEGLNNGIVNGLHMEEDSTDSLNGHLPGGCSDRVAQELKAFVSSTFRKQFVLTLSELKRLFNLHLASLPPGHILFSGISDKMLQDMVLDIGCKQILVPFPPQTAASPDELKVYALWEAGDIYDQHRQVLLEIFSKNYRVRRNVIQNQLSQDLNKQEVDRVLKDCCVSYGGMWYLKGTVQS
ncbi:DNA-directed RNA polymerase III subunit RPC5 isoform X1 [Tympanuchus pallidicinctus]|uniref:DNA-directed RNA polymerase III subunit RPC5 n=1 Tax=Lagopus leucura TaxID=30410 RepID=UPI001C666EDF|nr:DNA-directed RNA polymerase III subunit RPC5 [Lagopus leucura]XP_042720310.1 DNA-directed RNA polymerase III subunit RPC5 [Lagopus leucura]XP_042720311.1 DNA-directed RNA polymerase III subunit RPC5 [Lagopus leucura]XP_042720312.1 DNA-directed RNA polymerase III subunit RPC5 [Lagopus leucura]XP_048817124.1 DNA-directed RNA polymerase III subunit RPC5 [Lagopus muta]XP_048817125.1 DNA-directed RNA polymerase III subunit RPC5 [Lagopus muta]XP_048817126.1 DNA-directed RNA polymerase III subuni